ncbi:methyl-accepting chemotaxis protein [Paenibacillus puerhi]|uniref:methyl-accepting chemotaxis protein n=1 Tax=Paenibacillus puerhi TaxID=2692622 RepID=UPI00135C23BC|nr:methyl-accepting chemotaxis protein [Paenibacillus puerhi]
MITRIKSLPVWHLTLQAKLILSFVVLLAIFAGVSAYHRSQVNGIHDQVLHQNHEMQKQQLALELKIKTNEIDAIKSGFLISRNEALIETFESSKLDFYALVEQIASTASNADQRKWSARLKNTSTEYTATFDSAVTIVRDKSLSLADMNDQLAKLHELSQVHKEYIFELVDQFNQAYAQDVEAAVASSSSYVAASLNTSLLSLAAVLILSSVVAVILIRSFSRPIKRLQEAVKRIAQGDLSQTINHTSRDELGNLSRDFDHMVEQVRTMLANTKRIASTLSGHSETFRKFSGSTAAANRDIVRAIQEISSGTEKQARHTEHSSISIAELSSQVQEIARITEIMQRKSREAAFNTYTGSESMAGLKTAAQHSEGVLQQVFASMDTLSKSSAQIGKIVSTITEISTQTNVLALNAAIEAARAGVHGKGFSVIAEEVRLLSGQTNESSKQIGVIVKSLAYQIGELEAILSAARQSFELQNGKMEESSTAFQDIRQSMDELNGHITLIHERIAAADVKNNELVHSIQHVAGISQETAAGVEEVNSSSLQQDAAIHQIARGADDMRLLAQQLFDEMSTFKIGEEHGETEEVLAAGNHDSDPALRASQDVAIIHQIEEYQQPEEHHVEKLIVEEPSSEEQRSAEVKQEESKQEDAEKKLIPV